jgi:PHD/YefM family antitoxin component YafN of YafNO toxin-antitoxin module
METLTVSEASVDLCRLIDRLAESHEPIAIAGKRVNAVLVSAEHWQSVQETLHLLSVPGMRESIKKGVCQPVNECGEGVGW